MSSFHRGPELLRRCLVLDWDARYEILNTTIFRLFADFVAQSLSYARGFLNQTASTRLVVFKSNCTLAHMSTCVKFKGKRIERGRVCFLDPWALGHFVSIGSRRVDIQRHLARNSLHHFTSHVQVHPAHGHDEPLLH